MFNKINFSLTRVECINYARTRNEIRDLIKKARRRRCTGVNFAAKFSSTTDLFHLARHFQIPVSLYSIFYQWFSVLIEKFEKFEKFSSVILPFKTCTRTAEDLHVNSTWNSKILLVILFIINYPIDIIFLSICNIDKIYSFIKI